MLHYQAGTPLWVELVSLHVDASIAFYADLFGWDVNPTDHASGYRIFSCEGKIISGIRPLLGEGLSPQWITFLSTDDTTQTANHVKAVGGKVLAQPDPDEERQSMLLHDREGAVFGIFHHTLFSGAQVFNQPVSLTFNQLTTQEPEEGKRFYSEVFGWQPRERNIGGGFVFTYFFNGVRAVAGLMTMHEPAFPAHWKVYFAVENANALVSRAIERGGRLLFPATDGPFGRFAELSDPQGATFSIIQQTPEVRAAAQTPMGVLPF